MSSKSIVRISKLLLSNLFFFDFCSLVPLQICLIYSLIILSLTFFKKNDRLFRSAHNLLINHLKSSAIRSKLMSETKNR